MTLAARSSQLGPYDRVLRASLVSYALPDFTHHVSPIPSAYLGRMRRLPGNTLLNPAHDYFNILMRALHACMLKHLTPLRLWLQRQTAMHSGESPTWSTSRATTTLPAPTSA
jgi:hypothetical protein